MMKIGIFGASGLAREVADICFDVGADEIVLIDYRPDCRETDGLPIVDEEDVPRLVRDGFRFLIGIGDTKLRTQVFGKFSELDFGNVIHPAATFGRGQKERMLEGRGNIVAAGARLTNQIRTGNFGYYHVNCTVGHDCVIDDFVNVAPGANVSGNVHVREGAYIGTGAAVLQGRSVHERLVIGKNAMVGAGAVVTKSVPQGATVVGIPARILSS